MDSTEVSDSILTNDGVKSTMSHHLVTQNTFTQVDTDDREGIEFKRKIVQRCAMPTKQKSDNKRSE